MLVIAGIRFLSSARVVQFNSYNTSLLQRRRSNVVITVMPETPDLNVMCNTQVSLRPFPVPTVSRVSNNLNRFLNAMFVASGVLPNTGRVQHPKLVVSSNIRINTAVSRVKIPSPSSRHCPSSGHVNSTSIGQGTTRMLRTFLVTSCPSTGSLRP